MRLSAARPSIAWRSSAVRRRKFTNSARSRWSAARYSSRSRARRVALARSGARSRRAALVGEMSISSARCWARVRRSGGSLRVGMAVRRRGGRRARSSSPTRSGPSRWPASRRGVWAPGRRRRRRRGRAPVGGEDEGDLLHVGGPVLVADEDPDPARRATVPTSSPRYARFSRAEKTRRSLSLWANSGAPMTFRRPSLKTSSTASPSYSRMVRRIRSPTRRASGAWGWSSGMAPRPARSGRPSAPTRSFRSAATRSGSPGRPGRGSRGPA